MRAAGVAAAKVRRRHLPSLSPTSIIVSLDPVELGAFEVWVADLPDPKPSREEAAAAYRPDVGEEMSRTQSPLPSPPAAKGRGDTPRVPGMHNGRWRTPQPPSCEPSWGGRLAPSSPPSP